MAVLAAATVIARSPGLLYNGIFDRDEAYLSVMGDVMRGGGTLYVDVIDRKPPLVPLAYELARSLSVDMRMVRLLCALAVLVNGVLVALLVRRLADSRNAALAGGVLAVLGTAWFLPADAQAANFELWGLAPATGAVLAAVIARGKGAAAWRWFLAAGALVAVAAHAKQPYIAAGLPVAFEAVRARTGRRRNLVAGAAGAVLATLPLLVLVDLGSLWRWAWADNGDYLDGGLSTARALGVGLGLTVVFLCFHLPLLYGFWAAVTRRVKLDPTVLVWALASLAVIPLGLRFFGHYYQQLVPPLAVLSGVALATASRWAWRVVGGGRGRRHGRAARACRSPTDPTSPTSPRSVATCSAPRRPTTASSCGAPSPTCTSRPSASPPACSSTTATSRATGPAARPCSTRRSWPRSPSASGGSVFFDDVAADPPELVIDAARPGTDWAALPAQPLPPRGRARAVLRAGRPGRRPADLAPRPRGLPDALSGRRRAGPRRVSRRRWCRRRR